MSVEADGGTAVETGVLAVEARVAGCDDELEGFVTVAVRAIAVPELVGARGAGLGVLLVEADYEGGGFDAGYGGCVLRMKVFDLCSSLYTVC